MRIEEVADAAHHLHLARLGHAGQASGQLADHLVLVVAQAVEVDLGFAEQDAVGGQCLGFVDHGGVVQQRLGRDAAHVQANAAERAVAFYQHSVHAQISGAEGGRIAAGAGTQHQHVALDVGAAAMRGGCGGRCCRSGRRRCRGRGRSLRGCRCSGACLGLHGADHRALADLVAHLDLDLHYLAGDRRRHVHARLVGLQHDQGLFRLDRIAGLDQYLDHFHRVEIADIRHLDFDHTHICSSIRARLSASGRAVVVGCRIRRRRCAIVCFVQPHRMDLDRPR
ncbi:hypothetical protein FQZ97_818070 [compost metagenome]